jgi:hypothetical protein
VIDDEKMLCMVIARMKAKEELFIPSAPVGKRQQRQAARTLVRNSSTAVRSIPD